MILRIDPVGTIHAIYGEEIDLGVLGPISIHRASSVEPDGEGRWWIDLSPVGGPRDGPFDRRSDALAAEQEWLLHHWLSRKEGPMSDRRIAEIEIGGPVPLRLVPDLMDKIKIEGVFVGWGEVRFQATNARELLTLAKRTSEQGTLLLANFEAIGGRFEALEEFLVQHRIAFDRRSEAKGEYDGESCQFRPNLEKPLLRLADQMGRPAFLVSDFERVRSALEHAQFGEACRLFESILGPDVRPLTALCIES